METSEILRNFSSAADSEALLTPFFGKKQVKRDKVKEPIESRVQSAD
jgi:hypothetical protein